VLSEKANADEEITFLRGWGCRAQTF